MTRNRKPRSIRWRGRRGPFETRYTRNPSAHPRISVEALLARFRDPKRTQSGWAVRCPAHDDRSPSAAIFWKHGDFRPRCYCSVCSAASFREGEDAILAALGLTVDDLRGSVAVEERRKTRKGPRLPARSRGQGAESLEPESEPLATAEQSKELERILAGYVHQLRRRGLPSTLQGRGLDTERAVALGLGRRGDDAVIPLRLRCGVLANLKYRLAGESRGKYRHHLTGVQNPVWMSPDDDWEGRYIDVFEGELDAAVAHLGRPFWWTVGGMGSAASRVPWDLFHSGRVLRLQMDDDKAGRNAARKVAAEALRRDIDVRLAATGVAA